LRKRFDSGICAMPDVRCTLSRPIVKDLHVYMREQITKLSRGHDLVKTFNYILKRWTSFTLFLEDGRVCLSNNSAERASPPTLFTNPDLSRRQSGRRSKSKAKADNSTLSARPGPQCFDRCFGAHAESASSCIFSPARWCIFGT
jgi:Transposase IS66 family